MTMITDRRAVNLSRAIINECVKSGKKCTLYVYMNVCVDFSFFTFSLNVCVDCSLFTFSLERLLPTGKSQIMMM